MSKRQTKATKRALSTVPQGKFLRHQNRGLLAKMENGMANFLTPQYLKEFADREAWRTRSEKASYPITQ